MTTKIFLVSLVWLFLGCKEEEKPWWWDASFHHDVNPCDSPPPTEREVAMGYDDLCAPREAARIKASVAEWKRTQALIRDAGCGDAWVRNSDGTCSSVLGCTPPDDAWVRNPDGTCRLKETP